MNAGLVLFLAVGAVRMVGAQPEFPLRLARLDGDVSEILLQVYDPEKEKWIGWGLFHVERDRDGRAVSGRAIFRAPREGEWRLRAVARSRSGGVEKEQEAAFEATAVYDATPPRGALWCGGGAVVWASSEDGKARLEATERGVWVELGRNLPPTGSVPAPLRAGQKVRLTLSDEAGNSTVIEAASGGGSPSGSLDSLSCLALARKWLDLGLASRAEETLRLGLRSFPGSAPLAVELAGLLTRRGRPAEALRALDGTVGLDASLAAALAHAELGNAARARALAEEVADAAPAGSELRRRAEDLLARLEER